jgi:hypothetical protein
MKRVAMSACALLLVLSSGVVDARTSLAQEGAPEQSNLQFESVGHLSGDVSHLAIQGTTAYADLDDRLTTFDLTDPLKPRVLGQTSEQYDDISDIAVDGEYVYLAVRGHEGSAGASTTHIVRVSDSRQPVEIGEFTVSETGWPRITVADDRAYLTGRNGLHILDVTDPVNPVEVGSVLGAPWKDSDAEKLVVANGYAYAAEVRGGLHIVDVSDPANPLVVATWMDDNVFPSVSGVALAGRYAYVTTTAIGRPHIHVLDVSDPANPVDIASTGPEVSIEDPVVSGSRVYAVHRFADEPVDKKLVIVDVADAMHPAILGSVPVGIGAPQSAVVAGMHAYVAAGEGGLRIFDVSDGVHPVEVGAFQAPVGSVPGLAVAGTYAYAANGENGVHILDVSDPSQPAEVGFYRGPGNASRIAVAGTNAYVLFNKGKAHTSRSGLRVLDVSAPARPREVGALDVDGNDLAVAGSYAYVADGEGVRAIDVSDPTRPTEVGAYLPAVPEVLRSRQAVRTGHVAVAGQSVVVAFTTLEIVNTKFVHRPEASGLRVVDVSDPRHPREAGVYPTLWDPYGIGVRGNFAYVLDYRAVVEFGISLPGGLHTLDISDPAHIAETDVLTGETAGKSGTILFSGQSMYATRGQGLQVVDLSAPAHPVVIGSYGIWVDSIGVSGSLIYLGGSGGGVEIVRQVPA